MRQESVSFQSVSQAGLESGAEVWLGLLALLLLGVELLILLEGVLTG